MNPPGSRQIRQYLANIGFDKHFVETRAQLQPDKAESCYQLRFTSPQVKEIVGIAEFCQRYVVSSSDSFSRIELALSEIMDNVKIHSQSPIGGCMVGQYYSRKKLIKIALCDLGVSIPFHLSQKRPYSDGWNDEQLLAEAFKLGVTGTTERTGLGLFEAAQFTRDLGGRLIVCSRSAVYHIEGHQEETSSISENFPGTIISLHWPTT
ncbi:MAG: hypothetical protein IPP40_05220 [bacterium]|nr:hypothetical protein [bacterium]